MWIQSSPLRSIVAGACHRKTMRLLKRLKIHQYRTVQPGVELRFHDTFNVIVGLNGSGKTTLLELIAMIQCDDFRQLKDEPFSIEYEWSLDDKKVVFEVSNRLQSQQEGSSAGRESKGADRDQLIPSARIRFGDEPVGELSIEQGNLLLCRDGGDVDVLQAAIYMGGNAAAEPLWPFREAVTAAYYAPSVYPVSSDLEAFFQRVWAHQTVGLVGRLDEALE